MVIQRAEGKKHLPEALAPRGTSVSILSCSQRASQLIPDFLEKLWEWKNSCSYSQSPQKWTSPGMVKPKGHCHPVAKKPRYPEGWESPMPLRDHRGRSDWAMYKNFIMEPNYVAHSLELQQSYSWLPSSKVQVLCIVQMRKLPLGETTGSRSQVAKYRARSYLVSAQ